MNEEATRKRGPAKGDVPLCRVSVLLPAPLLKRLDAAAKEQGGIVNRSDLIRAGITKQLNETARV